MASFTRPHSTVLILDFGSQYTHLIARRLRELRIYCELHPYHLPVARVRQLNPAAIILSGGPASVYHPDAPHVHPELLQLDVPILGICYGLQEIVHALKGHVHAHHKREFGHARLTATNPQHLLFKGVKQETDVWMSHGDKVVQLPDGFHTLAVTSDCQYAAIANDPKLLYGLQFHPEVTHTIQGTTVLKNFVYDIAKCTGDWTMSNFVKDAKIQIRKMVGNGKVIGAVSGGVDSTVAAVLMKEAIGDQFHAFLVDNGLMRKDEVDLVNKRLAHQCGVALTIIHAQDAFLHKLQNVTEPEKKRKIIGQTFIQCFEKEATKLNAQFLLQGTLYPDVIESTSHKGPSATIKTHHNVGGLPDHMKLKLIEPLRYLFKDEVRNLGIELGLTEQTVYRHPFPGPGLAIRILGPITNQRLIALRDADAIFLEELRAANLYTQIGQAFAVLLPVKAVGVMGDKRTYEQVITLRAVKTTDYMTADWFDIPTPVLRKCSSRIVNEVKGVNRVTYDITSKPPGTIEWE